MALTEHVPLRLQRMGPAVLFALLAVVLWAGPFRHVERWTAVGLTDIPTYRRSSNATGAGLLPYRDVDLEYPPGAALVFYVARFLPGDYEHGFRLLMMIAWVLATTGAVVAAGALRLRPVRQVAVGCVMATTPLLLGSLVGTRYDGVVTATMAWMLVAAVRERWRWMWGLLVVAILLKLMPALLAPALAVWQIHRAGWPDTRRSLVCAGVSAAALFAPFAIIAPRGLWAMIHYHLERPSQIESTAASYLLVWHAMAGAPVSIASNFGSQGPVGTTADVLASTTTVIAVAALVVVFVGYARSIGQTPAAAPGDLVAVVATMVVVLAVGSKVLSPQYLLWMIPAALLLRGRRGWLALGLVPLIMIATQMYFPTHYWSLVALDPYPITILAVRNLLLFALAVLCWPVWCLPVLRWPQLGHTARFRI